MSAKPAERTRTRLRRLGARREELARREEILRRDTERELRAAAGVIPVTEAARLVRLGRATVYQNYLDADATKTGPRRAA